jgi:hypothetical protein
MGNLVYKTFPPGWAHIRVPVSSTAAAKVGLAMFTPCRPLSLLLHSAAWRSVQLLGPRALPGLTRKWRAIADIDHWNGLMLHLRQTFGPFEAVAGFQRIQQGRAGFMLILISNDRPIVFLKIRFREASRLAREAAALQSWSKIPPSSFYVPGFVATGRWKEWHYLAQRPLPPLPHHPMRYPDLPLISHEICRTFRDLERPSDVPGHWQPMHGDLTPWNLRRMMSGEVYLLDWEDLGWGPPGADLILYAATAASVLHASVRPLDFPEAIAYWRRVFLSRIADAKSRDLRLARQVLWNLWKIEERLGSCLCTPREVGPKECSQTYPIRTGDHRPRQGSSGGDDDRLSTSADL